MDNKYERHNRRKYSLKVPIVLVTKYRKQWLKVSIADDVKWKIFDIANAHGYEIIAMETDKDHIHFLLSYDTTDRVCDIVKIVKQETTHYLWQKYNAVLSKRYWIFKEALDSVLTFCFDHVGSALNYKERFSVIDAFQKHSYVPKIYMHVNLCSMADNSTQLVPFLKQAEKMKDIKEYHDIEVFLHFEPTKGHNGIGMNEAIEFLYHILDME